MFAERSSPPPPAMNTDSTTKQTKQKWTRKTALLPNCMQTPSRLLFFATCRCCLSHHMATAFANAATTVPWCCASTSASHAYAVTMASCWLLLHSLFSLILSWSQMIMVLLPMPPVSACSNIDVAGWFLLLRFFVLLLMLQSDLLPSPATAFSILLSVAVAITAYCAATALSICPAMMLLSPLCIFNVAIAPGWLLVKIVLNFLLWLPSPSPLNALL